MHITQKGYILARPDVTGKATHFFWSDRPASGPNDLLVRAHDISFSVPADFDYRAERINAACKVRADIQRRFDADMEAVNAQIDALMGVVKDRPAASRAYYRNDGNAHIASRGLGC